ncbi:MAG TPA: YceI family protein [Desulfobacterales bacterium]
MKRCIPTIIGLMMLAAIPAHAEAPAWEFDREHSSVFFDIKHIYYITRGVFEDFSGEFRFDPNRLEDSRFEITIQTDSVNTYHRKRDRHLRSEDFLDTDAFPVITFKSEEIRHLGGENYEAVGQLIIKDVSREVILPFRYLGMRDNPFMKGKIVAGFESSKTIDRLEYHVGSGKYYEMGVVGKDVNILISLEMIRDK